MATPPNDSASGILSDNGILRSIATNVVTIVPFRTDNLNSASYDVTLGPYYFRENAKEGFLNLYREDAGTHAWLGPYMAKPVSSLDWEPTSEDKVEGTDLAIVLRPGETILAHTCEFIGGVDPIVPALVPCSGLSRTFIQVEGGIGSAGFHNRWALRITNTSKHFTIPLIAGRKIAQVVFYQTEGVATPPYGTRGAYQKGVTMATIAGNWKPTDLLPQMHTEAIRHGKLSMRSDPAPQASFVPFFMQPKPVLQAPQQPPQYGGAKPAGYGAPPQQQQQHGTSMVNPDAARAAAQQQHQYQQQAPIHLRPATRDANGEMVAPLIPPELRPLETRNIRGPPIAAGDYDPYTV